jgi:hypothetical protein
MKRKLIALACITACAGSALAATSKPNACTITAASANDVTSQSQLVNKCAPEITFFIGGASAQANALKTVLTTNGAIFNTALPFVKVRNVAQSVSGTGSESTAAVAGTDYNTIAYIGYGAFTIPSIAGKRVMVVYNKANGSFAGVNTLLTGAGGAGEETTLITTTVKEQATAVGKAAACGSGKTAGTASYDAIPTYDCTTEAAIKTGWGVDKQKVLHLALSDVRPSEAVPGVVKAWKPANFPATATGMQGFGVVVNVPLYNALIEREVAAKSMPDSCRSSETFGDTYSLSADCQPSISSAEYAALMTGKINSADALLGTAGDTHTITLNRRVNSSGTQAAAEIFFAGRALYNPKTPAADGYLSVLGGVEGSPVVSGRLTVATRSTTDNVLDAIRNEPTHYALGVISLDKGFSLSKSSALKGALWVKLDGISPNMSKDPATGATVFDSKTKVGFARAYPFVYEAQAIRSAKLSGAYLDIFTKIIGDSTLGTGLVGQVGLNGFVPNASARFTRGDSNFYPLTKY